MYEALGKSNVDGARMHSRVSGIGRSTQGQEEEGMGADGGRAWVPGADIYWDSWVGPARCTLMSSSESFIRHFSSVIINTGVIYTMTTPCHRKTLQKLSGRLQNRKQH